MCCWQRLYHIYLFGSDIAVLAVSFLGNCDVAAAIGVNIWQDKTLRQALRRDVSLLFSLASPSDLFLYYAVCM